MQGTLEDLDLDSKGLTSTPHREGYELRTIRGRRKVQLYDDINSGDICGDPDGT